MSASGESALVGILLLIAAEIVHRIFGLVDKTLDNANNDDDQEDDE